VRRGCVGARVDRGRGVDCAGDHRVERSVASVVESARRKHNDDDRLPG
jgi:hypothetical protein